MTPITELPAALVELSRMAQADACPTLTNDEQIDILNKYRRAQLWTASTAYNVGDIIIPTAANRNGHRYRLAWFTATATDRQSGLTEPVWSMTRDSQHTDNHVVWIEDGWDWDAVLWDLYAAAAEAWEIKAGKSINRVDFAPTQGASISASQLYDHCKQQALAFRSAYCL